MHILLHACCAPCANQCVELLRSEGSRLTLFWYNPNIHPFTEYRSRRNCLRDFAQQQGLELLERDEYALRPFVRQVAGDLDARCGVCYALRLRAAAQAAAEGGFDGFISSLFISPYQNHELMAQVARQAAEDFGVAFCYRDFRPLFRQGQDYARQQGMYIQKYCGCVFSEEERYVKPKKIIR